ncbi:MAG: radical SAM protein [Clostridia bacterium]|nr:radical SAM protein [Clostridia bacterium]
MANIVLSGKCNLRCPYCFAEDFTASQSKDMEFDDVIRAMDFIADSGSVGLIGGEPLLYKNIDTVLSVLNRDYRFRSVMVFTNGVFIKEHIDFLSSSKVSVLVNLNPSKNTGKASFDRSVEGIKMLLDRGMGRRVTLGINIYEENQDISEFTDTLRAFSFDRARISVTIPQDKSEGAIRYFERMKPTLLKVYRELKSIGVAPCYDCNTVPHCIFTEEEREFIRTMPYDSPMERELLLGNNAVCSPIIDIYPDGTATRCFGCYDDLKADIKDFRSLSDLSNFFFKEIDAKRVHTLSRPECKDCYDFKTFKCYGGCLCYKR